MSAFSGVKRAPEYPAAVKSRPQFASLPNAAVLQSGDLAIALATRCASLFGARACYAYCEQLRRAFSVRGEHDGELHAHLGERREEQRICVRILLYFCVAGLAGSEYEYLVADARVAVYRYAVV